MGTIAGSVIGTAAGGPAGGAIGGFVGGLFDNFVLFPLLFPKPPIRGPRLNDLSIQTASEGDSVKRVIGPENRIAGTIIWAPRKPDGKLDFHVETKQHKVGKGVGGQRSETYEYFVDLAIKFADTRGLGSNFRIRKIFGGSKVIYAEGEDTGKYASLTIYDGTQTAPDPLMESYKGVGNVPVYKHSLYVVIERLALADWGAIPNITAMVEQDNDVSLAEAVGMVLELWGFDPSEYDVSSLSQCFWGTVFAGPQAGTDVAANFVLGYGLTFRENGMLVEVLPKGSETIIDVDPDALAAHSPGRDVPQKIRFRDYNDMVLPQTVLVKYSNIDNELQQGTVGYSRQDLQGESTIPIDLNLSLLPGQAREIAARECWAAETERQEVEISLPPSYLQLRAGDVIRTEVDGETYTIFCSGVALGANYEVRVTGRLFQQHVYTQSVDAMSSTPANRTAYTPPETVGLLMNLPALVSSHVSTIGLYYAVYAADPVAQWMGAQLYALSGGEYSFVAQAPVEATVGTIVTPPGTGPVYYWDRSSTIIVQMQHGTLETVTESQCIAGLNRCAIRNADGDWEVLGFQQAVKLGETAEGMSIYRLTNLLRGLRGTEGAMHSHEPGSPLVLLEADGAIGFHETGLSSFGATRTYKFPASQGLLADYDPVQVLNEGATMLPFPPAKLAGEWNGSNDLTVSWTRRSRLWTTLLGPAGAPLADDEKPEEYEVEFLIGTRESTTVLRTVTVPAATSTVYTAAQQTADGLNPGVSPVRARVYQISTMVGRGRPADAIFTP